jgi:hypothetical protein
MVRTRQILAVTLVATALAADRAIASTANAPVSPQGEASVMSVAGRIVSRLTSSFRRVVPAARVWESRQVEQIADTVPHACSQNLFVSHTPLSPFQFRLPPPALS